MNNEPEAVARVLVIVQRGADPSSLFEQWYFDSFTLDIVPPGWQVEVTYKLRRKTETLADIWNKVLEPMVAV